MVRTKTSISQRSDGNVHSGVQIKYASSDQSQTGLSKVAVAVAFEFTSP